MYDSNDIPFNEYSLDFFAFLNYIFARIFGHGGSVGAGSQVTDFLTTALAWISTTWSVLVVLSWLVSGLLVFGLIYAYIRHAELNEVIAEILKKQEETFAKLNRKDVKNSRWQDVETHISSDRPNDWKLAIVEADIVLGELLDKLGYAGNSIGEKLKSAPPSQFQTLTQAWRAHNIRNRIAHEGADFELSHILAQETIAQYKMVLDEFDFI